MTAVFETSATPPEPVAPDYAAVLEKRIASREALVAVIGLGYVGLPSARLFRASGFAVLGYDIDADKIRQLQNGRSYLSHVDDRWIRDGVVAGTFTPTNDPNDLIDADVMIICAPTPLSVSRDPDLSHVEAATRAVVSRLRSGQLVILESTTYPGTTRDVVAPLLAASGLELGREVFLAYAPEREDPGSRWPVKEIPKVVGGLDEPSLRLTTTLYTLLYNNVVRMSTCEAAEACKLLENTYRCVNIALVNELKVLFDHMRIDVWEVIEAARTKPYGFQPFFPGPGLGGHCIPVDPFYLSWLARRHGRSARFVELAGEINTAMPEFVADRVTAALNDKGQAVRGARIGLLGVAYKPGISDTRDSPALALLRIFADRGARVAYVDPYVPELRLDDGKMRLESAKLTVEFLRRQDCVVIVTDHDAFDYSRVVKHASLVVDTRNATRGLDRSRGNVVMA